MVTLNAHFDGKVIVPDEPLNLPANQKLRIQVEPIDGDATAHPRTDWHALIGIARDGSQRPHDPAADEDALWEKGPLPIRDEGRDR